MQEETNEKTIALYIKTGKLTAQQLQKAMKALLAQMKKQHDKQKIPHGKQTLKQLMKQNAGVSNIEITKDNIKAFESTAKKYGIDFALKKDSTETPPRYLVFFKGRDADALTAAFKEFSAKKLTQEQKPSMPTTRNKRDVWLINTVPYKGAHFAAFPPKLAETCILAGCPKGGIVIDPFFGSGTTGFAAKSLDRHYIGIELNAEYCALARARIGGAGLSSN